MTKITIAFDATATPNELAGAGYYVKELLHELDVRSEVELKIITRKSDKKRFKEFAPSAEIINVSPDDKLGRLFFQTFKLGPIVDELEVDIFHGPHYQIPKNMKTRSVVTIHDMTLLTHKDVHTLTKRQFFTRVIPASIKKSKSVITVSQSTADDIKALIPKYPEIFVAPLGVDSNRFNPNKSKTDANLLSNRGITSPYIAFLGLFEPRKSVPTLINAFERISKQYPNLKLVLAGAPGWGAKEIRESIVQSGIATRIIVPGRLSNDEVGPFLRNCEAFVYPSLYEGFGMPVLEAMACGSPTITTNSSSLKEVAGKGALLFEPKDEVGLEKILLSLFSDEDLKKEMSDKAIKRAKDFTWSKCAQVHIDAFTKAMEN